MTVKNVPILQTDLVLLPFRLLPIKLNNSADWQMALSCHQKNQPFGLVMKTGSTMQRIGCLALVEKITIARSNGTLDIIVRGTQRFIIRKLQKQHPHLHAHIYYIRDYPLLRSNNLYLQAKNTGNIFQKWMDIQRRPFNRTFINSIHPSILSFFIAGMSFFTPQEQQKLLETRSTYKRLLSEEEILLHGLTMHQEMSNLSAWLPNTKELSHLLN